MADFHTLWLLSYSSQESMLFKSFARRHRSNELSVPERVYFPDITKHKTSPLKSFPFPSPISFFSISNISADIKQILFFRLFRQKFGFSLAVCPMLIWHLLLFFVLFTFPVSFWVSNHFQFILYVWKFWVYLFNEFSTFYFNYCTKSLGNLSPTSFEHLINEIFPIFETERWISLFMCLRFDLFLTRSQNKSKKYITIV